MLSPHCSIREGFKSEEADKGKEIVERVLERCPTKSDPTNSRKIACSSRLNGSVLLYNTMREKSAYFSVPDEYISLLSFV